MPMASVTLSPVAGWAVGETINAYLRDSRNVAVGSSVATATVGSNSTTTFTGLDADKRFIASDGANAVRFDTLTDPDTGGSGVPDGGTTGQGLVKQSDTDGDATWIDVATQAYVDDAIEGVVAGGTPTDAGYIYVQEDEPAALTLPWLLGRTDAVGGIWGYDGVARQDRVVDSGADTAGSTLLAHTPELGGPVLTNSGTGSNWKHSSTGVIYNGGSDSLVYYSGAALTTADYRFAVRLHGRNGSGGAGITIRTHSSQDTWILLNVEGTALKMYDCVTGSVTALDTAASTLGAGEIKDGYFDAVGTLARFYLWDEDEQEWVLEMSATTSVAAAGKPGFRGYEAGSNTNGVGFSNIRVSEAIA